MNKILAFILKLLISGTLLLYLFYFSDIVDLQEVIKTLRKTRLLIYILAFFTCLSAVFIASKRWSLFLPKITKFSRLVSLVFISNFFNTFLPGRVGGEVVRMLYIHRDIGRGEISLMSVFMDKYMALSAIMAISLLAFIGGYSYFKGTEIAWIIPVSCSIFLIISFIFWNVNWGKIKGIRAFYTYLMAYKTKKKIIFNGFLLSFIIQLIYVLEVYLLSLSIDLDVPIIYFFIFVPIINIISAIPITVGGLGLREAGFTALFNMFFSDLGVTSEQAISLSMLIFVSMILISLLGGIEYLRIKRLT